MVPRRFPRGAATLTAATACLSLAAVAYGANSRSFKGKTSQKQGISFKVSGGFVRNLDYHVIDKCPGGLRLNNHDFGFKPIRLVHSKFGGTFRDRRHHAKTVISGTIRHGVAQGTITDQTRNAKHQACTGEATFRLHRS